MRITIQNNLPILFITALLYLSPVIAHSQQIQQNDWDYYAPAAGGEQNPSYGDAQQPQDYYSEYYQQQYNYDNNRSSGGEVIQRPEDLDPYPVPIEPYPADNDYDYNTGSGSTTPEGEYDIIYDY